VKTKPAFIFIKKVPPESNLEMLSTLYPSIVGTLKVAASHSWPAGWWWDFIQLFNAPEFQKLKKLGCYL